MIFLNVLSAQEKISIDNWTVKPGTPEWKNLQTHEEMLLALQIPDNKLIKMSTEDLVETCLNYPLFADVWAFNSYQDGINEAIKGFNGFRELLKRTNSGDELLKKYKTIDIKELYSKKNFMEKGDFKMRLCKCEALLSQITLLNSLSRENKIILLSSALEKNTLMNKSGQFSFFNLESNAYLLVKTISTLRPEMINEKSGKDINFRRFCDIGTSLTNENKKEIAEMSKSILSNNKEEIR